MLKLVFLSELRGVKAKVYKDTDWQEFRVKFYVADRYLGEVTDYHTDDEQDAKDTAKAHVVIGSQIQPKKE